MTCIENNRKNKQKGNRKHLTYMSLEFLMEKKDLKDRKVSGEIVAENIQSFI